MRFDVTSATPAGDLLQRIATGMDRASGWSRESRANRWISHQEGRRVTLSLETTPGSSAQDYQLELRVHAEEG